VLLTESGRNLVIELGHTDVLGHTKGWGVKHVLEHMADMELAEGCWVIIKQGAKAACGQIKSPF
jgi:hypothetical protein